MGDVGVDLLKPKYGKDLIVAADTAYWEALYDDGTVLCEAQGAKYAAIDRSRLQAFRIIHNGENVFEILPPPGVSGRQLIYRRRTMLTAMGGGRDVTIIAGWAPYGPIYAVKLATGSFYRDDNLLLTLGLMPGEPDDLLTVAS